MLGKLLQALCLCRLPLAGVALLLPEGVVHFLASYGYNTRHIVIDSSLHGGQQNHGKTSANVS